MIEISHMIAVTSSTLV